MHDEYDQISPIRNNKFCVTKYDTDNNSSIGIIDDKGTVICPLNYNYMEFQYNYYTGEFSDVGIARQKDKSTYELINVDGKKYNDSEWLSASFYIINSVTGYKVDGKSYIFQKNEDGIFEESAHIMYNTQQQIIYGYNIKVLYNKASQNIEFQDKCNRFVIEYICALNEENLTVIEEKSTNNFYNGVKNINLSAYSAEERDYYSAKRLMGQKIEFFVQINTPEADQNTITSYVILCIGDDSYDVEINLIKDSQGNLLVSGLVY